VSYKAALMYMDCAVICWPLRINRRCELLQIKYWKLVCITLCFLVSSEIYTVDDNTLHNTQLLVNTKIA
jgi:hypothetical protein